MSEFDEWPQGTWVGENRRRLDGIAVKSRWKLLETLKDMRDQYNANARMIAYHVKYDGARPQDFANRAEAVAQNDVLGWSIEDLCSSIDGVDCTFSGSGKTDTHDSYLICELLVGEEEDEVYVP